MREEFKREGWRDFQQRFQDTFGWYEKANGTKVLVQLEEVREDQCIFRDENNSKFTALSDVGNHFSFLPVVRGVYNSPEGVMYCQRVPARQYKRGICANNTKIVSLVTNIPQDISFPLLETMFSEPFKGPLEAFKIHRKGAAALTRIFSVIHTDVLAYDKSIGKYDGNKIVLDDKLFVQELQDIMVDHALNIPVEVA